MAMMEQPPLPGMRPAGHVGALRTVFVFCEHCRARVTATADRGVTLTNLRARLSVAMDDHLEHWHPEEDE